MRSGRRRFGGGFAARLIAAVALLVAGPGLAWGQKAPGVPQNLLLFAGTAPVASMTVLPASITVQPGATVQFSAQVMGTSNSSIAWTATAGVISAGGAYTAPNPIGTYTVTASIAGGSMSRSATVTVDPGQSYIAVSPGEDIQARLAATPAGSAFRLRSGVHRLQTITPRDGDTITGEAGTVLSGARLLTQFTQSGQAWIATGQTQEGPVGGECKTDSPRCSRPEDLFIDNVMLKHVDSVAAGGAGRWYFDYSADRIYIWDNPAGRTVETSVTQIAFMGSAKNVSIIGLIVEKYANPAQTAAIRGGNAWTIEANEVRWNHGIGIAMGPDRKLLHNKVHHNGQMGIGGSSVNGLVEGNEIAYNNTAGFNSYWEAGGTKFTFSSNLMVRDNFVHHNGGPGLWTDIDNINIVYEYNVVEDNENTGIFHEISYDAIIRHNKVSRNGTEPPSRYWSDGGILVANSKNVEVYGNTLTDNWQNICGLDGNRGSGSYGVWRLENLNVHDNVTNSMVDKGGGTGLTGLFGRLEASTSQNNKFQNNKYNLHSSRPGNAWFNYLEEGRTPTYWQGTSLQDTSGTITQP